MIQRHPLAFSLALALLVALPTLAFGFWIDDYYHLAILELGDQVDVEIGGPLDLFYFAPGDPEIMRKALDSRPLPWFTLPELHLHFFRPLTSALFTLDHALWGLNPLPYHVHSVLWYLVLICAVWSIFRRTFPWTIALLATAMFTLDDVHTIPVAWIANRNGLLAVALVFLGLAAHLAWRRDGKRWGLPVSMICYVLGLCAGEAALSALAYVFAYEVAGIAEIRLRRNKPVVTPTPDCDERIFEDDCPSQARQTPSPLRDPKSVHTPHPGPPPSFPPSKGVPESSRAGDVAHQPHCAYDHHATSIAKTLNSPSSPPETRTPKPDTRALLPAAFLTLAYLVFYKLAGYGVSGSGMYLDPLGEPFQFLRVAPARMLSLIGAQLLAFPAEISIAAPALMLLTAAVGLFSVAILVWLLRRIWPHMATDEKRAVTWLILGAVLGLIPVAATFPSSRLLMAPSLGFAAAVALILYHGWKHRHTWGRPARAVLVVLAFIHCIAAPGAWWVQTGGLTLIARYHDALFRTAEISDDPARPRLVYLRAPEPFSAFYATAVRALHGHPMPQSTWSLSLSDEPQEIERIDARTLEITMLEGRMLDSPVELLFRSPEIGYSSGDRVEIDGLVIEILDTDAGFPTKVRYTFDEALETGPYQFIGLDNGRLVKVGPPAIGERQHMPRPPGIFGIELRHLI